MPTFDGEYWDNMKQESGHNYEEADGGHSGKYKNYVNH